MITSKRGAWGVLWHIGAATFGLLIAALVFAYTGEGEFFAAICGIGSYVVAYWTVPVAQAISGKE